MSSQKKMIADTVEEIKKAIDLFYQQKNREALNVFEKVIGKMMNAVDALFIYKTEHEGFMLDEAKIADILKEAMAALEAGDTVLMADIFQYDFIEYVEELLEDME